MGLDVPAIGPAGQTLKYVKAAYDVARDGGGPGVLSIPSQQLPAGAFVLGWAYHVLDAFADNGNTQLVAQLGIHEFDELQNIYATYGMLVWDAVSLAGQSLDSLPITVNVSGDGFGAGSMYIYVFYV